MKIVDYSWNESDVKDGGGICLSLRFRWDRFMEGYAADVREEPSNLTCDYSPPMSTCPASGENRHARALLAVLNNKCSAKSSLCET